MSVTSTTSVRVCGLAFALIFTAYNTAQNYMTTLLGARLGSAALVLVYGGIILASPFAPGAAPRFGIPKTLAVGGLTYAALMAALLVRSSRMLPEEAATLLVLLASFANGVGGSLLWSAQGSLVILEASTDDDSGRQSGDFWALFHLSTIFGNAWAAVAFSAGASSALLFALFLVVALCGVACFSCVTPAKRAATRSPHVHGPAHATQREVVTLELTDGGSVDGEGEKLSAAACGASTAASAATSAATRAAASRAQSPRPRGGVRRRSAGLRSGSSC